MGRHKLPQTTKKTKIVNVRFTEKEFKKITQVLRKQGLKSLSPQIRVSFMRYIEAMELTNVNEN